MMDRIYDGMRCIRPRMCALIETTTRLALGFLLCCCGMEMFSATAQMKQLEETNPDTLLARASRIACDDTATALSQMHAVLRTSLETHDVLHEARAYWNIGYVYELHKLPVQALPWFERALERFESLNDELGMASSLFHVGFAIQRAPLPQVLKDFPAAEERYRKSADLYERHRSYQNLAPCLFYLAATVQLQGRHREAISLYRRSIAAADSARNLYIRSSALTNIGFLHARNGRLEASAQCFRECIQLADELGDTEHQSRGYNNLSSVLNDMGRTKEAEQALRQAYDLAKANGNPILISQALTNIAGMLNLEGKYEESMNLYAEGLVLTETTFSRDHQITASLKPHCYRMIGTNARSLGRYMEAIDNLRKASAIYDDLGNREGQALVFRDLGWSYFELERLDRAHHFLSRSLGMFRDIGKPAEICRALVSLAPVLMKLDSVTATEHLLEEALAISEGAKLAEVTANIRQELGRVQFHTDRLEEAEQNLAAAAEAHRNMKVHSRLATDLVWLAECRHARGKTNGIEPLLSEAEHLAENIGKDEILMRTVALRAELAEEAGKHAVANAHWRNYRQLKDSVTTAMRNARYQSLLVEFDAERKDHQIALLSSEQERQRLEIERQTEVLRRKQLEAQQHQQDLELLARNAEIRQLELDMTAASLRGKEMEAERKTQEIDLLKKDRQLRTASLERETMLRNIFVGSSIAILLIAFIAISALRARRRASDARARAAEEENRRLAVEKKQEDYERRKAFTRQLIASQEQERKRIAADLHDSIAQDLLIINNRVRLTARRDDVDRKTVQELNMISSAVTGSLHELKDISRALRPLYLDRIGLSTAIEAMLSSVNDVSDTAFIWDIVQMAGWFTKDQEINIYRVVQEAVNNILKHSGATHATVHVGRRNGHLRIEIHDNGKGIAMEEKPSQSEAPKGFGLQGMYERVDILGGNLNLRSAPGNGTAIEIFIPIAVPEGVSEQQPLEKEESGRPHA